MKHRTFILYVGLMNVIICDAIAGATTSIVWDPYVQETVSETTAAQTAKEIEQMLEQIKRLDKEIAQLENFQNPDTVRGLLAESNKLIAQSKDIEYTLNKETDFAKSYQGYKTLDEIQGGSGNTYDSFYKDNADMTLSTINSTNKAIEETNSAANDPSVNNTVTAAQGHISKAQGTTQAVSGLAEINIQILQQLQAINSELAAMAEGQNAAAAEEIQEEATEKAEVKKDLAKDAEWVSIDSNKSLDKLKF